jgi:hypothetical protein
MIQILIRFLVGGAVVSAFALIGDVLKPKSFAELFGALFEMLLKPGAQIF